MKFLYLYFFLATMCIGEELVVSSDDTCITESCDCACVPGRDGRDGLTVHGRDGRDGRDCVECRPGPQGPKGAEGDTGAKGDTGVKGKKGEAGAKGDTGVKGTKGDTGAKGDTGVKGRKGDAGAKGDTGTRGEKGNTGDKETKGSRGDDGKCDQTELAKIKQEMKDLRKEELAKIKQEMKDLRKELSNLQETTIKAGSDHKIKQSYLPAGYSDYSVYDLQWQSIHMAAAAACRGSTEKGGYGPWGNTVFPRVKGLTCNEVCGRTKVYKECDAELAIYGYVHKATKLTDQVGSFFNYGCNETRGATNFEPAFGYKDIVKHNYYLSYCCCRKP